MSSIRAAPAASLRVVSNAVIQALTFNNAKTALFFYIVLSRLISLHRHLRATGLLRTAHDVWVWLNNRLFLLALRVVPSVRHKVARELKTVQETLETKMVPKGPEVVRSLVLPATGQTAEEIEAAMDVMDGQMKPGNYKLGKFSGMVYHGGDDMQEIIVSAFKRYTVSNPLHPDAFPTIRKMEAEVVAMCLRMYNNPSGAGTTTSGGTESIIMAVKTHRDWARATKGISHPEMVLPASAHAAFDKAADYFGIKVYTVPVNPETRKVDLRRVSRAITPNTIMLVGSAVNFPDGNMDDIPALGLLAQKYGIGLHVDCCLGSFIMPFLEEAGFPCAAFDFRVPGVTSISCDTHKYGFAPKGSSVVMYRSPELRRFQYFVQPTWPGGCYASPSIAGSRPGAIIAGTWAAMQYMGRQGYLESCRSIVSCTRQIAAAVESEIPELYVLGQPPGPVVAFGSREGANVNVLSVGDKMSERGWHLNGLSNPPAIHIACTRLTVSAAEQFVEDLKDCVEACRGQSPGSGTLVTVYGLGNSSAVGPALMTRVASLFLDVMYKA